MKEIMDRERIEYLRNEEEFFDEYRREICDSHLVLLDQLAEAEECLHEIATKPHGAVRARKYLEGVEDEDT